MSLLGIGLLQLACQGVFSIPPEVFCDEYGHCEQRQPTELVQIKSQAHHAGNQTRRVAADVIDSDDARSSSTEQMFHMLQQLQSQSQKEQEMMQKEMMQKQQEMMADLRHQNQVLTSMGEEISNVGKQNRAMEKDLQDTVHHAYKEEESSSPQVLRQPPPSKAASISSSSELFEGCRVAQKPGSHKHGHTLYNVLHVKSPMNA